MRHPAPKRANAAHLNAQAGAAQGPTRSQLATGGAILCALTAALALRPQATFGVLHMTIFALFAAATVLRIAAVVAVTRAARPTSVPALPDAALPAYTVIVPLYREANMIESLLDALGRLDYPARRLQILLVLEADDKETIAAAVTAAKPGNVSVLVAPPGVPRTKPRACNVALQQASGELVTIYDAEDRPAPGQLRDAAARFSAGPPGLACLQAPLRIDDSESFLARQFALEYASQFEIVLPALAGLDAPFPLGGTSNHFKASALRDVGGWDAWNVTEDADMGFRLTERGYQLGVMSTPTFEPAPELLKEWLPQRARWVKGYMQTFGVHTRRPLVGGAKHVLAFQATMGLSIVSAFAHGPLAIWIAVKILLWAAGGGQPLSEVLDIVLLIGGWTAAAGLMTFGANRAGLRLRATDLLFAVAYWPLQSLAALHALEQLLRRPYHWDKTPHRPVALRAMA